jgi:hypothetical protein
VGEHIDHNVLGHIKVLWDERVGADIADNESAEVDLEKQRGRRGDPEEVRRGRQQERVRKLASGDSGKWLGRKNKHRSHKGTAGRNGREIAKRKNVPSPNWAQSATANC